MGNSGVDIEFAASVSYLTWLNLVRTGSVPDRAECVVEIGG